jgi:drug/metabolite transporter (DMT)-like permease
LTTFTLNKPRAIGLLVVTAVLWSFGGLLVKSIHWNPIAIAGGRSAIAALVIFLAVRPVRFHWSSALVGGTVAYAANVTLFVVANKLTSAANAIVLQWTAPIYVALFGRWFLGEPTRRRDWITIIAVLGGMTLFFVNNLSIRGFWGNICAIASGVAFGWMALFMRKQKHAAPVESVLLGNVLTALIGIPFYFQSMPDLSNWISLLCLGVFQLGFSYLFYSAAIKHVTAIEASLIPVLEPLLNPVWVLLFMGEVPSHWAVLGGVIVLAAITVRGVLTAFQPSLVPVVEPKPGPAG